MASSNSATAPAPLAESYMGDNIKNFETLILFYRTVLELFLTDIIFLVSVKAV